MAKVALQLLTYHRVNTLPLLFASLQAQSDKDWTLYWLDNASTSDEQQTMHKMMAEVHPDFPIVFAAADHNLGFDGGHERLFHAQNADYVMCVNDDAILEADYVRELRKYLDDHLNVAAASGKIFRWDWVRPLMGDVIKTEIIDSLGLAKTRCHKVYDLGAGQKIPYPRPDPIPAIPVWGVSGCLPMYRRVAVGEQLFDPAYFMYKEDVDLAYRLNKAGWQAAVVPTAVAYHHRSFRPSFWHQGVSFRTQWLSYRNHWRNLRKHLTLRDWLKDGWAVLPYEAAKTVYIFLQAVWAWLR